jgi:hypothetical protein
MNFGKDRYLWQSRWHIVAIYVAVIIIFVLAVFTDFLRPSPTMRYIRLFTGLLTLVLVLILASKAVRMLAAMYETNDRLEKISEALEKGRSIMAQINQNTRLSEATKSIAFRDIDRQTLREAVFDKLQQQDYETTYKIIDEIAHQPGYKEFADQLRSEANEYRDATDTGRINQVITYIDKLLDSYQWTKASIQIERLIKDYPESEKAKSMRQKLLDKKEERKKMLLTAWDEAIKRQATDRGLEVLRELDLYLTPNEGLALQEAARDVFRTKLHNLGVQFALAVSAKQWADAINIGQQIMRDFPNSKMAVEIHEKWDALKEKLEQRA